MPCSLGEIKIPIGNPFIDCYPTTPASKLESDFATFCVNLQHVSLFGFIAERDYDHATEETCRVAFGDLEAKISYVICPCPRAKINRRKISWSTIGCAADY